MLSYIFLSNSECKEILRYVLETLRTNITPEALLSLCVLKRNMPKKIFDIILQYIENRLREKNLIIIEETLIREAVRTVIIEKKPKIESRKPTKEKPRSLIEILQKQEKEETQEKTIVEKHMETETQTKEEKIEQMEQQLALEPKQKIKQKEHIKHVEPQKIPEKKEPTKEKIKETPTVEEAPTTIKKEKKEHPKTSISIIKKVDWYILSDSTEAFRQYFLNRYNKLKKIIQENIYGKIIDTSTLTIGQYKDTYLILIVDSKKMTKGDRGGIIVGDDENSRIKIYVPLDRHPELRNKFQRIISDTVVAVKVDVVKSKKFIIASDIIFPDIPRLRERHNASRSIKILVAADLHVGSKAFMKENFENFIEFLQAKTNNEKLNALAEEIEYILLIGDLVDGVGVYPSQKDELAIPDHKKQYETLANYLQKIPDDKQIICVPGNHDASTRIIPQPPIAEEIAKPLYDLPTVKILSNPATIEIDGVKILMYHGQGFERIGGLLGIPLTQPTRIVGELLRYRHLHPEWGTIPQAPLPEDNLVIEKIPDIVLTGHLHIYSTGTYKGTAILSSGAFEGLTTWQRDIGITPTIGYFHIIDINTYETLTLQATETEIRYIQSQKL